MQQIGVAMIGTGFMGAVHIEALKRIGVQLRGILGVTPEIGRSAADSLGLPHAYTNYDEVLNDPKVQSVHLGVPNNLHLPMARQAILAGKHVLCEKPLAMNSHESAELVALAKDHPNLALGVNYNVRFYPLCHEAREQIRSGELGRIFHVTGSVAQDWLLYETDFNWRVLAEEGGASRAVSDIGTHWLDLIHFITGLEVEEVCADFATVHPIRRRPSGEVETFSNKLKTEQETIPVPVTTEDYGSILLRFVGGARGTLWVSQVSAGRKYCIRYDIAGQNKSLFWNSERCEEMWVGSRTGANQIMLRDPAVLHPGARAISDYPGGHPEGYPDTFKMCFREFYRYIAAGDFSAPRTFATFEDGHQEIALCEAILKSVQERRWVKVKGDG